MNDLPEDLYAKAIQIVIQVREKPSWKELLGMQMCKMFAYISLGLGVIRIFRVPILETTEPDKLKESLRGIIEHEFAHFFGLNDEQAWKAAS